jgi:hypothetical protein
LDVDGSFGMTSEKKSGCKVNLKEMGHKEDMGWIQLAQDRVWWQALMRMVTNFQVPFS